MKDGDDDEMAGDDLKALITLYELTCFALRELRKLDVRCPEAEQAMAAAQAAIAERRNEACARQTARALAVALSGDSTMH